MTPRLALASTIINFSKIIDSFVNYHLSIGFEHLYLFIDNPDEPVAEHIRNNSRVTITKNDSELHRRWQNLKVYNEMHAFIDQETMARQNLNCELAMEMALASGCDWLLHIDMDELFLCAGSLHEHFSMLSAQQVDTIVYNNHEAVPENLHTEDFFREVTLFKTNINKYSKPRFTPRQLALINASGMTALGAHFLLYSNGKSAVRLDACMVPDGPHRFRKLTPGGEIDPNYRRGYAGDEQQILHYACCDYRAFLEKYQTLGNFDRKWFGKYEIKVPFHLASRDVVQQGDPVQMEKFFRDHVMLENLKYRDQLMGFGALRRIKAAQIILGDNSL